MTLPPPRLRDFLRGQPGRCDGCYWHVPTMGHQPDCPNPQYRTASGELITGPTPTTSNPR